MAKTTITVEDLPNGAVKIEATPNFETMLAMDISGNQMTPAHTYTLRMLSEARAFSKLAQEQSIIQLPKIVRAH